MERKVVIAGFARSPFHFASKGELATVRPDELAAQVVRGLLEKTGVDYEQFPDLAVTLVVPKDGGASTSLASYQLEVLREKNRELTRRLHELFGNAQENERLAVRTHQLSLALMRKCRVVVRIGESWIDV